MKKSNYFIPIAILVLIAINLGLIFSESIHEVNSVRDFEVSVEMKGMDDMHSMSEEEMEHMNHNFVESGQNNPELHIMKGELVSVSFKNTNSMQHNFVIPELGIETDILEPGETGTIHFKAHNSGNYEYLCSLHPDQMKGLILISK